MFHYNWLITRIYSSPDLKLLRFCLLSMLLGGWGLKDMMLISHWHIGTKLPQLSHQDSRMNLSHLWLKGNLHPILGLRSQKEENNRPDFKCDEIHCALCVLYVFSFTRFTYSSFVIVSTTGVSFLTAYHFKHVQKPKLASVQQGLHFILHRRKLGGSEPSTDRKLIKLINGGILDFHFDIVFGPYTGIEFENFNWRNAMSQRKYRK